MPQCEQCNNMQYEQCHKINNTTRGAMHNQISNATKVSTYCIKTSIVFVTRRIAKMFKSSQDAVLVHWYRLFSCTKLSS